MLSEPAWVEGGFRVAQELGFHLRPAGRFVRLAAQYDAEVEVSLRGEEWVSGQSLLALASLGASKGSGLRIRARGRQAGDAVAALGHLVEDPVEPQSD